MSRFNHVIGLGFVAVIAASSAFAGTGDGRKGMPGQGGKEITWQEMQERCARPKQFPDLQIEPQNIRIQCADQRHVWVQAASGEIPLPGTRTVTAGVYSDKHYVGASQHQVPVLAKSGSCPKFIEVLETMAFERGLTCNDVLSIKGDVGDYCASILDSAKGSNPKLISQVPTGREHNTCGEAGEMGKGK